jgi:PAS domain S-box-containing protein
VSSSRQNFTLWIGFAIAVGAFLAFAAYRLLAQTSHLAFVIVLGILASGMAVITYALFRMRLHQLEDAQTTSDRDLQESKARFEQLFHLSPFPATVTSLNDGRLLASNEAAVAWFGNSADNYVDPAQQKIISERVVREGRYENQLLHLKKRSSERFWASVSARSITYEGAPAVLSVFHDVTEQVAAEKALRASEQRLAEQSKILTTLMERQTGDYIFEDRLPDILETCSRTLGIARVSMWQFSEDRNAIHCVDLYESHANSHSSGLVLARADYPEYFSVVEEARLIVASDAINHRATREFSASYLKPLGIGAMLDIPLHQNEIASGVMCLEHVGPPRVWTAEEQNFALSIANLIDLAQSDAARKEGARKLAETELRSRMIVDTAHDAFIGMNSNGEVVMWNAQAAKTFGWSSDEALGHQLGDMIIPPAFREGHRRGLRRFLESGEAPVVNQTLELTALHQSGTEFPIEITITNPIRSEYGYFFGAFVRDISVRRQKELELRQAKESAEAATRAKSEFLANMSHELRTPLNGVLGYAQLLQRGKTLSPDQRESLDAISKCGSHLLDLINDVLDLSKIEAGHMELEPVPTDLHQLTVDLTHVIAEPARRKGLRFSVEISPDIPGRVVVDGRHLRQVLLNLLGNAVKFTSKGEIHLAVARNKEGRMAFAVSDSGMGIEEENLKQIFEEFRQTRVGSAAGGSGLGLTISQRLVHAMGGELAVRSTLGEGSTFFFDLALVPAEASSLPAQEADQPVLGSHLAPGSNLTALVVDDSSVNRRILASLLESAGAQVITAGGGIESIELAAQYKPDVILMDLRMRDMDGLTATRKIHSEPQTASIPVIMVTASAFGDARQAALDAGCIDFIPKPIRAEQLFQKLQRHLGLKFVAIELEEKQVENKELTLPSGDIAVRIADRILEAASIGNVSELEAIALELGRGGGAQADLGKHIARLSSEFDFEGLIAIAKKLKVEKGSGSATV